jgi:hypothetical protein
LFRTAPHQTLSSPPTLIPLSLDHSGPRPEMSDWRVPIRCRRIVNGSNPRGLLGSRELLRARQMPINGNERMPHSMARCAGYFSLSPSLPMTKEADEETIKKSTGDTLRTHTRRSEVYRRYSFAQPNFKLRRTRVRAIVKDVRATLTCSATVIGITQRVQFAWVMISAECCCGCKAVAAIREPRTHSPLGQRDKKWNG